MSPDRELLAHAKALRLLARDLVGESDADDLLQETALQALTRPPQQPGPFGGWLASVLRHLASKHRRAAAIRKRHEQAAARPERVAPSREVEDCDAFRRLSEAVVALPEPYRGVLLARYLRDESPAAIAKRTGVPVRTVKTRLSRGLALLRERFDGEGDDWRAGFAGVFGLGGVAAGIGAGVAVMATGTKLAVGGGAVVLAVVAGLFMLPGAPAAKPMVNAGDGAAPSAVVADLPKVQSEAASAPDASLQRREVVAEPPIASATLRGRCVDGNGNPLAGVEARLDGTGYLSRLDAWLRDHAEPAPIHQQTTTAADGTFAFTFAPPPPFKFQLELRDLEHVAQRAFWRELAAGATTDLGDVVLPDGARVQGRVVDTDASDVAGAPVTLHRLDPELLSPAFVPIEYWRTTTAGDGTFTVAAVPPGNFAVEIEDRCIAQGSAFRVGPELHPQTLAITVLARAEGPSITGVVTDEDGRPLAGVFLGTEPSLRNGMQVTGRDGRFEIRRREGDPEQAPGLRAERSGFENWRSKSPVAWNTGDLKVAMRRGVGLELRVTDATTGAPVEDYQVRAWPEKGPRSSRLPAPECRAPRRMDQARPAV